MNRATSEQDIADARRTSTTSRNLATGLIATGALAWGVNQMLPESKDNPLANLPSSEGFFYQLGDGTRIAVSPLEINHGYNTYGKKFRVGPGEPGKDYPIKGTITFAVGDRTFFATPFRLLEGTTSDKPKYALSITYADGIGQETNPDETTWIGELIPIDANQLSDEVSGIHLDSNQMIKRILDILLAKGLVTPVKSSGTNLSTGASRSVSFSQFDGSRHNVANTAKNEFIPIPSEFISDYPQALFLVGDETKAFGFVKDPETGIRALDAKLIQFEGRAFLLSLGADGTNHLMLQMLELNPVKLAMGQLESINVVLLDVPKDEIKYFTTAQYKLAIEGRRVQRQIQNSLGKYLHEFPDSGGKMLRYLDRTAALNQSELESQRLTRLQQNPRAKVARAAFKDRRDRRRT